MLHGIMVLHLKLDWGKCVLPVSNCCRRAMVWFDWGWGNTSFWEGLVLLVYGGGVGFSSRQVMM